MTVGATTSIAGLSNADLLAEVTRCAARERDATVHLIAALAELDARRLYLGEGCSSLFTYCTQILHLSEHAAYARIEAARAARKFPVILQRLADGSITLTAVGLLAPHLSQGNHRELLDVARHRSKRSVEQLAAQFRRQPDAAASVRKLPTRTPDVCAPSINNLAAHDGCTSSVATRPTPRPAVVSPLAPERYNVQFTVSRPPRDREDRQRRLARASAEVRSEWDRLDQQFLKYPDDLTSLLYAWVKAHPKDFGSIP